MIDIGVVDIFSLLIIWAEIKLPLYSGLDMSGVLQIGQIFQALCMCYCDNNCKPNCGLPELGEVVRHLILKKCFTIRIVISAVIHAVQLALLDFVISVLHLGTTIAVCLAIAYSVGLACFLTGSIKIKMNGNFSSECICSCIRRNEVRPETSRNAHSHSESCFEITSKLSPLTHYFIAIIFKGFDIVVNGFFISVAVEELFISPSKEVVLNGRPRRNSTVQPTTRPINPYVTIQFNHVYVNM